MSYNNGKSHPRFIELTGKQFGKLKILDYIQVKEKRGLVWKWKCLCECGNYTYTRTKEFLKEKPVQSCASCGRKRMGKTNILPENQSLKNRVYRTYQKGAINRGYKFDLDFQQVMDLISKNCYYCDSPPEELIGEKNQNLTNIPFLRNGIDRKDNKLGYITENVVTCCKLCNRIKMDLDYNLFLQHITKIYSKINK